MTAPITKKFDEIRLNSPELISAALASNQIYTEQEMLAMVKSNPSISCNLTTFIFNFQEPTEIKNTKFLKQLLDYHFKEPSLSGLHFKNCTISDECATFLGNSFAMYHISALVLDNCSLSADATLSIFVYCQLSTLELCQIDYQVVNNILAMLPESISMSELHIRNVKNGNINEGNLKKLCTNLATSQSIKELSFQGCQLQEKEINWILSSQIGQETQFKNCSLLKLDFSGSNITNELVEWFLKKFKLETLILQNTKIDLFRCLNFILNNDKIYTNLELNGVPFDVTQFEVFYIKLETRESWSEWLNSRGQEAYSPRVTITMDAMPSTIESGKAEAVLRYLDRYAVEVVLTGQRGSNVRRKLFFDDGANELADNRADELARMAERKQQSLREVKVLETEQKQQLLRKAKVEEFKAHINAADNLKEKDRIFEEFLSEMHLKKAEVPYTGEDKDSFVQALWHFTNVKTSFRTVDVFKYQILAEYSAGNDSKEALEACMNIGINNLWFELAFAQILKTLGKLFHGSVSIYIYDQKDFMNAPVVQFQGLYPSPDILKFTYGNSMAPKILRLLKTEFTGTYYPLKKQGESIIEETIIQPYVIKENYKLAGNWREKFQLIDPSHFEKRARIEKDVIPPLPKRSKVEQPQVTTSSAYYFLVRCDDESHKSLYHAMSYFPQFQQKMTIINHLKNSLIAHYKPKANEVEIDDNDKGKEELIEPINDFLKWESENVLFGSQPQAQKVLCNLYARQFGNTALTIYELDKFEGDKIEGDRIDLNTLRAKNVVIAKPFEPVQHNIHILHIKEPEQFVLLDRGLPTQSFKLENVQEKPLKSSEEIDDIFDEDYIFDEDFTRIEYDR